MSKSTFQNYEPETLAGAEEINELKKFVNSINPVLRKWLKYLISNEAIKKKKNSYFYLMTDILIKMSYLIFFYIFFNSYYLNFFYVLNDFYLYHLFCNLYYNFFSNLKNIYFLPIVGFSTIIISIFILIALRLSFLGNLRRLWLVSL